MRNGGDVGREVVGTGRAVHLGGDAVVDHIGTGEGMGDGAAVVALEVAVIDCCDRDGLCDVPVGSGEGRVVRAIRIAIDRDADRCGSRSATGCN